MFTVTSVLQSKVSNDEPVVIKWYTGENLPEAMAAMVEATARTDTPYTETLSVSIDMGRTPRGI